MSDRRLETTPKAKGTDVLDDRRCRITLLERDAHDPSTPRLDCFASDDLIGRPVGALHEHVG